MKIAIIGAGCAGLVSARYCLKETLTCDVFEQTDKIGGVWNYTDKTAVEENDLPIHTVMYKDLRTNLPKELMSYSDFAYPDNLNSFLTQPQVLSYMQRYANHFNLLPNIKFCKQVAEVRPSPGGKWIITVIDLRTKLKELVADYDGVMICNGHYHRISLPEIEGSNTFQGFQMHSHVYRSPERFTGLRVLVIGAGPSGQDIASKISKVAQKVFISHRFSGVVRVLPAVVQKPVVKQISGYQITFEDDTKETADAIVYCTGYKFDFPFLSKECEITYNGTQVKHLYKHIINVEHPSMAFIGICNQICPFPVCDAQVQFYLSTLMGRCSLLPKSEMMREIEEMFANARSSRKQIHRIAEEQKNYVDDIAKRGNFKPLAPVFQDLFLYVRANRNIEDCFRILDDDHYKKVDCKYDPNCNLINQ